MPGTDVRDAVAVVAGELPDWPHVPELPARGPGSDLVGRTAVLLADVAADLAVATTPTGWRFADGPGRDVRRGAAFWREDLDTVEEVFAGVTGPVKSQLCGPWTLAASVELRSGERAVRDDGAVRELAAALAEAAAGHVADLRRRLPAAELLVCLDEPLLPVVGAGAVPTASGFGRIAAVPHAVLSDVLAVVIAAVVDAGALPLVHSCAARPPVEVLVSAGVRAVSLDLDALEAPVDDEIAAAVERGVGLLLGVAPPLSAAGDLRRRPVPERVRRVQRWWHRLGFDDAALLASVAVSPGCGLAGADPASARAVLGHVSAVARALRDDTDTPG
jgi:hypothetical protein